MDVERPLVDAAAAGSREAFDELVGRYQAPILNLVRAMTAGSVEAEDLTQDVFVRAWRNLAGFRGDSTFRTWIYRVAINVIQSHRSRAARWRRLFQLPVGTEEAPEDPIETAPDPDDLEQRFLQRDAIDRALATLPEDLRLAVILRDVQGLDYRAIADLTGAPIGTVESRIFRARQRLRSELGDSGGAPRGGAGNRGSG